MATIILITMTLMIATIGIIDANSLAKRAVPSTNDELQAVVALNNAGDRQLVEMQAQMEFPWEALLISAPISINLLGQLVVISAKRDFPLHLHTNLPYKRLRHTNFRPTLVQVSNEGWEAFNEAHSNMDNIRLHMSMIPTNVRSVLRIMSGSGTPVQIARYVRIPLSSIENSAAQCVSLARSTYDKFLDVQTLLNEVSEVLAATEGHTEEQLRQNRADRQAAELERNLTTNKQKLIEQEFHKVKEDLNKAQQGYESALSEIPTGWKKLGQDFVRGLCKIASFGAMKDEEGQTSGQVDAATAPTGSKELSTDDNVVLDKASKIQTHLDKVLESFDIDRNSTFEHLTLMKQLVPDLKRQISGKESSKYFTDISKLINDCSGVAAQLLNGLNGNASVLDIVINKAKVVLHTAKEFVVIQTTKTTGAPTVRSNNLPTASVSNERFKATMAQQQLNKMQDSYAKIFDQLMEENDKLQRLMVRLASAEIEATNFRQILEILSEAIGAISQIREKWGQLVMFFQRVSAVASVVVNGQVSTFLNLTRTSVANQDTKFLMENLQDEISENAISTARAANFLLSVSSAYVNVSQTHLMGRLASLTGLLTVKTASERSQKMHELEQQSRSSQNAIKEICMLHKIKFEDQIEQEKQRIDQIFQKVGRSTPEDKEAIVRGNQRLAQYGDL